MRIIATLQNADGTYDNVGMKNRRLFGGYKTIKGALKHSMAHWKGCVRFEFFSNSSVLCGEPFCVIHRDRT